MTDEKDDNNRLSWWQVFKATMMSFLGVQSEQARIRDTQHDSLKPFIIMGIAMTVVFVLLLVGLVQLILYLAGV